jgi:hypothetical protein
MDTLVKVGGYSGLVKDTKNGGVINVDKKSYEQHQLSKNLARQRMQEHNLTKETVSNIQQEVESIKNDVSMIKEMLMQLTGKGK